MLSLPDRELSRAILIGASRFQRLPNLPAVRNNLADLRAALTDPEHGIIAPDNCVIVEEPESPHTFMTSLKRVIRRTDDFLLVYYAGHGLRDDAGDKLYLTLGQTDREELDGSAVEFDWVKRALEESRARASLLVLDCCYSGMAAGIMSDGAVSQWEIKIRGSAVLASSARNRTSRSPEGDQHTAFTGKVIHLLRNGSPIKDEPLTVNALYRRVSVALAKEEFPEPKLALTETSGDLLVRRFDEPPQKPKQTPPRLAPAPDPPVARVPPANRAVPPRPTQPHTAATHPNVSGGQGSVESPRTTAGKWMRLTGLRTLWIGAGVFVAMGLGAFAGVVTGARRPDGTVGNDAEYVWIGFVVAVVFGVPLWLKRGRWLALRRELAPPLVTRSALGRFVVFVGFAFCALLFVVLLLSRPSTTTYSGSDTMYRATNVILVGEGVALCGYLLVAWWRSRTRQAGAEHREKPGSRQ